MRRGWFLSLFALAAVAVFLTWHAAETPARSTTGRGAAVDLVRRGRPAPRRSRRGPLFPPQLLPRPARKIIDRATLQITADNAFTVWLNGAEVGSGERWEQLYRFDVRKQLRPGKNVLAVEARNQGGPAGLVVRLLWASKGQAAQTLVSDAAWKVSKNGGKGWSAVDFADKGWTKAKVLGEYGKVGPWTGAAASGTPPRRRFTVPEGFVVEQVVKRPDDRGPFSLVNMTFDDKGRLLLSQEGGPILLCVKKNKDGVYQEVVNYCEQVRNCQGMCWVKDALLLVGDGPKGTGLYRCRDTKKADKIDEVTLLHKFQGGMGEHGPHAVLHGPDNWLYVVVGNHAHAQPTKLADNSPLTRWPTGGQGPPMGRPDTTEDVLLPRQNDANGHAANLRSRRHHLAHGSRGQEPVAGGRRFPQRVRRRLQPVGRVVHLRQRHGVGREAAVVSTGACLLLSAGGGVRLAYRGVEDSAVLPGHAAGHPRHRPRLSGRRRVLRP